MRSLPTLTIAAILAAGSIAGAMAQTYTADATVKATASGQGKYIDSSPVASSNSNPNDAGFGSFGIVDFNSTSALASGLTPTSLAITLNNYPGKYAYSGNFDVFLSSNTAPVTTSSGFTYQGDNANDGIDPQLGTLVSLGSVAYDATEAKNTLDTYNFALTGPAASLLSTDLASGDVKLVFGAQTGSGVATGFDGSQYFAPTLTLTTSAASTNPVPEASTTVSFGLLLALGLGGFAVSRRRKVETN